MAVDYSLDNVTLVGHWREWGEVRELISSWFSEDMKDQKVGSSRVRELATRSFGSKRYQRSAVVDGAHVSNWLEESEFFYEVEHDAKDCLPGRIELNPNKATDRVWTLVRYLEVDHASRVDVALDYPDAPIGDFVWRRDRVKVNSWVGRDGLESCYLGSRGSDRFVRIYDKGLELRLPDLSLLRVEGMGRKQYALSEDLFTGVEGFSRGMHPGLSLADAGRVALFLHHPEVVRRHDKSTLKRYKELTREVQAQIEPRPAEVYGVVRPELLAMLESVSNGEPVRRAEVYERCGFTGSDDVSGNGMAPLVQAEGPEAGSLVDKCTLEQDTLSKAR